jgi:hypothetical protein
MNGIQVSPSFSTPLPSPAGERPAPKKAWTVLFYMDGKDDRASMARETFETLRDIGSDENVNMVAQLALKKAGTMRGLVEHTKGKALFPGAEKLQDVCMGDPESLRDYLSWAMKKYPAENYAVVLWDEGASFEGGMIDGETKDPLNNKELASVLKDIEKEQGHRIDLVDFSGKMTGQAEVAYELRNCARYMVCCEDAPSSLKAHVGRFLGDPQDGRVMKDLEQGIKERGAVSPEELAKLYVFESRYQLGHSIISPTRSALDLSKVGGLKDSIDDLAGLLLKEIEKDPSAIRTIRKDIRKSQQFLKGGTYVKPFADNHDLGDFMRILIHERRFKETGVPEAAKKVMESLKSTVMAEQHASWSVGGRLLDGATGISAYMPTNYGYDIPDPGGTAARPTGTTFGYETLDFARDTRWKDLLKAVSKDDDWRGKLSARHPIVSRVVGAFMGGPDNGLGEQVFRVIKSVTSVVSCFVPPALFPFVLPFKAPVTIGAGMIGGVLRAHKGFNKTYLGSTKEFTTGKSKKLIFDGVLDTCIGVGSLVACTTLAAGTGALGLPLGLVLAGIGGARSLISWGIDLAKTYRASTMRVEKKLDTIDQVHS